jgi:hypothetical protein
MRTMFIVAPALAGPMGQRRPSAASASGYLKRG